jgi:hypothetical protein
MKKTAVALLGLWLTASAILPNQSFAENQPDASPFSIMGKVVQGRMLVPVRGVSAGLGADVVWNPQSKTVTILNGESEVILKINSTKATRDGKEFTIDVPARVNEGVTYVPIRFVSQGLGGTISWDSATKTSNVALGDKKVLITTEATSNHSGIPQEYINAVIKKANEATQLSSYPQIRAHFKNYFTGTFINKIIQQKGLAINEQITSTPYSYSDKNEGYISQDGSAINSGGLLVERRIMLKYIQDKWMVDDIAFLYWTP